MADCEKCGDTGRVPCPYLNTTTGNCHYPGADNYIGCPPGAKPINVAGRFNCTIPCPDCADDPRCRFCDDFTPRGKETP